MAAKQQAKPQKSTTARTASKKRPSKLANKKRSSPGLMSQAKKVVRAVVVGAAIGAAKGAVQGAVAAGSKATGLGQKKENKNQRQEKGKQ